MAKSNETYLKWLGTLSTEKAWQQIVKDATVRTTVDHEKFLKSVSPLPDFKNPTEVRRWLNFVLPKIDLDMSVEEARVLRFCCSTIAAFFKETLETTASTSLPLPAHPFR